MSLGASSPPRRRREAVPMVVALLIVVGPGLAHAVVRLTVGDASVLPGSDVLVAVTLTNDGGELVAAVENDLTFDTRVVAVGIDAGEPACTVNAAINKASTRFGFRPPGCVPSQGSCTAVHAVVIALDNVEPIASGARLYTCRFRIAAAAPPGRYALSNSNVLYAPPPGGDFDAVGVAGYITVLGGTPGDVDCDGSLSLHDIEGMIGAVFGAPVNCPADCNGDGMVTAADLGCVATRISGHGNVSLEATR